MLKRLVSVLGLVALLSLTACGGDDNEPKSADESTAPEETPASSAPAAPKVSLATSCQLLIPGSGEGPMDQVQVLMTNESLDSDDVTTITDGIDTIQTIAETAQPELAVQLNALVEQAGLFLQDAYDADAPPRDTTPYKAAGIEVTQLCLGAMG